MSDLQPGSPVTVGPTLDGDCGSGPEAVSSDTEAPRPLSGLLDAARTGRRETNDEETGGFRKVEATGRTRARIRLRSPGGLRGYLYPATAASSGPSRLLVAVHGVTRNRRELACELLRHVPNEIPVLLPYFSQKKFRGYQRLEQAPSGVSPAQEMLGLLSEVEGFARVPPRITLFGFSGGAQFAHRFAMFHPDRVGRLITVSAGFYSLPDQQRAFPFGTRPGGALTADLSEDVWRAYLECPKHVFVGELDTERDRHLRQDEDLDRQQGRNRVERARRFALVNRMHEIQVIGRPRTEFVLLPRSGHSLRNCVESGGLGAHVANLLKLDVGNDRVRGAVR